MEIKYDSVYYSKNENTSLEKLILEDINLELKEGKINGIIGKCGSGKTTFLELMNVLLLPTLGSIQIGNYQMEKNCKIKDVNNLRVELGYVFGNPKHQFFLPTVREEIAFGMKQFSYKLDKIDSRISDSLKMVGLDDSYLERDPIKLSNGEMRKVAIASVLAFNPNILIFDEPTLGLDSISEKSFLKMLKLLKNKYHKTIVIVTHDVNMIHKIADYLFVFYEGKKVLEGTKYEVFESELLEQYEVVRPMIMEFSYQVLKKKGIKLGYRDDVNDLIKDIYRHVS
ncbi:MAG: ATP-binding cassette domain-containing protein [Bacilli bacterium]|jgi:energy-coupling factor transport system ATP-binding protein|nr:ATP-binding cassette domain-containing protein [Bacilli bacterium]